MTKASIENSKNPSCGILKIFKYISPLVFLYIYYAIGMYTWMSAIESSRYYFSELLPNMQDSINLWIDIFKISLFYILPLLIPFWVQFFITFTVYGKLKHFHMPLSIVSSLFAYSVYAVISVILNKLFKDMQGGPAGWYIIIAAFISIVCATLLAAWLQRFEKKHYSFLISDRRAFYAAFTAPLIITLIISLLAPIYNYKKGYGLSCDALSSARNYSNDGEEYIFSNRQNIDDQDIGNITPNMLEHKESSDNSKWEQDKYNEFRYSRWAVSEKILSSPVNKDNPISIKFLKLKDEGDDIRILITDVRKIHESNSHNPKANNINLLSNPVVITVPKNDLLGRGDGGNGVEKFCVKDRYN